VQKAFLAAECRYAWDKIKRLLERHGATVQNIDKIVTPSIIALPIALHESAVGSAPRRRESSVEEGSTRRVVD
jgi:hypothetical protein